MQRRTKFAAFAIVIVAAPFIFVILATESLWDGSFELRVNYRPDSSRPIQSIAYAFAYRRHEADALAVSKFDGDFSTLELRSSRGAGFVLEVPCSGRCWHGFEHGYTEPRFVVLRVEYRDGKKRNNVVDVPIGRGSRSVNVEIPETIGG